MFLLVISSPLGNVKAALFVVSNGFNLFLLFINSPSGSMIASGLSVTTFVVSVVSLTTTTGEVALLLVVGVSVSTVTVVVVVVAPVVAVVVVVAMAFPPLVVSSVVAILTSVSINSYLRATSLGCDILCHYSVTRKKKEYTFWQLPIEKQQVRIAAVSSESRECLKRGVSLKSNLRMLR